MSENWRWSPLHSEHMVPGSFWKVKNETSLYYLEDWQTIDVYYHGYWSNGYVEPPSFELDKIYFLAKIEENNDVYNILFLDDTRCIEAKVVKGCWDNVFELVQGSTNPQPKNKLFLGRIPLEELNTKSETKK